MKLILFSLLTCLGLGISDDVYIYQVACEDAQWVQGKKICSIYKEDVFLSIQSETDYQQYTVFRLKAQNIASDTVDVNPAEMILFRTYEDGKGDSVNVLNPEAEIEKKNREIAYCEEEIKTLNKTRNTQNEVVSVYNTLPAIKIGKKSPVSSSGSQVSNAIYQEKIKTLTNRMIEAKQDKQYWESEALLATSVYPLNFIDNKIYMSMNHCKSAVLKVVAGERVFEFPIIYEKL